MKSTTPRSSADGQKSIKFDFYESREGRKICEEQLYNYKVGRDEKGSAFIFPNIIST